MAHEIFSNKIFDNFFFLILFLKGKMARNYCELHANLECLVRARGHLEEYLEACCGSSRQQQTPINKLNNGGAQQQQQIRWRHKPEQPTLNKQISTQEIDKLDAKHSCLFLVCLFTFLMFDGSS